MPSHATPAAARAARATGPLSGLLVPRERPRPARGLVADDTTATMKIGEVSERVGMSLRSMRYYEEEGLITPAGRSPGGFRLYSERDVRRLLLIMQMKPLDFTLDEMRQVLADLDTFGARGSGSDTAAVGAARERLERLRADVEQRYTVAERRLQIAGMFREHLHTELAGDER